MRNACRFSLRLAFAAFVFTAAPAFAQTTIFSDGFEGAFPGSWTVGNDGGITTAKWGNNSAKASAGSYSAFCADNGSNTRTVYDDNLKTYMERRGVSLAGYTTATLNFKYWLNSEAGFDFFTVNVRDQAGNWHEVMKDSGNDSSAGWQSKALNLNAYAGQTGLYVQFRFDSDGRTINPSPSGVWVDEVALIATACPTPGSFSASSPGNGESLDPATSATLSWGASPGASRYDVKFGETNPPTYLKTVTGLSTSVTVAPGKTYYWFITAYPDCAPTKQTSTTQRSFMVKATPVPRVIYPNGGESLQGGQTITVQWTVQNQIAAGVELQYTTNNGATWTTFATNVTGTSRSWTLPSVTSSQVRVKVITYNSGGTPYTDQSDGTFTITTCPTPGSFSASSPGNGESLDPATSATLSWGASPGASRYDVKFGETNPPTYLKMVTGLSTTVTVAPGRTYYWFITAYPDCDPTKQTSTTQRNFAVKATPVPRVIYPNGGESLQGGQTITVQWTVQNQIAAGVELQYTTNNGVTWTPFATNVTGTSRSWTLPSVTSSQVRVKVITYDGAGMPYTDQSDGTFTITPPQSISSAYWLAPNNVLEGTVVKMRAQVTGFSVGDQFAFEIREDDCPEPCLLPYPLGFDDVTTKYGNVYLHTDGNLYVDAIWTTVWQSDLLGDPEFYFIVSRGSVSKESSRAYADEMHVVQVPDPYGVGALEPLGIDLFSTIPVGNRNNLTDLANLKNYGLCSSGQNNAQCGRLVNSTDRKLIIAIHGWNRTDAPDARLTGISNAINTTIDSRQIGVDWRVIAYDWSRDAATGGITDPVSSQKATRPEEATARNRVKASIESPAFAEKNATEAAERAYQHGLLLGAKILAQVEPGNLQAIHLIGHSAGSWAVYGALRYLKAHANPSTLIQVTYLDPYIPADASTSENANFKRAEQESSPDYCRVAGQFSRKAEQYYSESDITDVVGGTNNRYSFTSQPSVVFITDFLFHPSGWDGHSGPIKFYEDTIKDPNHSQASGHGWRHSLAYNEDITSPTVTVNQAAVQSDPTSSSPINFTVVFSESVTGFGNSSGDVILGGTAGATSKTVTGSGITYNVAVSGMTQSGTVTATIPAGAAQDGAGNSNTASTSSDNSVTYNAPDTTPPMVTVNQAAGQSDPTGNSPINFTVVFSEAVTGFGSGDVALGGTAGAINKSVTGSGTNYIVAVSGMTQSGTVTATVPAGVAQDAAGNGNLASTSTDNSVTYNLPPSGTLQFAQASYPVNENAGTVTLSVTRTGGSSGAVSVQYATANGTAVAPGDYTASSGPLNWANGDTSPKPITVPIVNDSTAESSESFTVTLSNPTGGATLSSPATATVTIADDDLPPTIIPVAVSRQQGSLASNATIANVSDANQAANTLTVTVNGSASATVNGVTVSNLSVDVAGVVTANVLAACPATNASFTLTVTDGAGASANATLNVTVTNNTQPVLTYATNQSVAAGGSLTINPATGPSDNGSLSAIVVQSQGSYTGTISVNSGNGIVSLSGAKPGGQHTITIRATDNCGAMTDATFTLTVTCPTITVNPATLPNGTVGTAYNQTVSATGGAALYSFMLLSGTLPNGLNLAANGNLTGTLTQNGDFTFTIKVTDANGCMGTQQYTVTINPPLCPVVTSINPASGAAGSNVTITGSGFTGVTAIKFTDNVAATFTVNSNTQITAIVPTGAVTGPITIGKIGCPDAQTGTFTQSGSCQGARLLPSNYIAGQLFPVSIQVTPLSNTQVYAVEDVPPAGWAVSAIDNGGQYDASNGKVKWGPFFDNQARTLRYSVTPPQGTTGTRSFAGTLSVNSTNIPICGISTIEPATFHSADIDNDLRIVVSEVTGYGAAWKSGAVWTRPPNPIPIEYVTNAGLIWKRGEIYRHDPSQTPPWVPVAAAAQVSLINAGLLALPGESSIVAGGTAVSSFNPTSYTPGIGIAVSIAVTPDASTVAYAVEDQVPVGWTVSNINSSGTFDSVNRKVKWGLFFDNSQRTFTYTVTPPVGETGTKTFVGTASFDSVNVQISGARTIAPVDIAITTQPINQTVCVGAQAMFSVVATGTTLTYQWRKNGAAIPGATNSSYAIAATATNDAGSYTVVVSSGANSITSNAATLMVNAVTVIVTPPANQTVCTGASATFTVAATGTNLSFQWRKSESAIPGATGLMLTLNNVTAANAGSYDVVVTGACGTMTSAAITLAVNTASAISMQPTSQSASVGGSATFTAGSTGTPAPTVQWQVSTDGGATFSNISGATSATLTVSSLALSDNGKRFRAVFTNSCGTATSNTATLTVIPQAVTTVSAASFLGDALATESIAAAFGQNLATVVQVAATLPLPASLAGTTVRVLDASGVERLAPLFFVAPAQVNFEVPPSTANGAATITITSGDGSISTGIVNIASVAPGLFSANADGRGVAAAVALRVKANGEQTFEPVARFDQATSRFVTVPIDLGPVTDQVFLVLFGTGMRFRSSLATSSATIGGANAEVLFVGPAGGFVGLDQSNIRLSRALIGRGEVDIVLTVDGKRANVVRAAIK